MLFTAADLFFIFFIWLYSNQIKDYIILPVKFPQSCEGVNHVHQHQQNFDGQLCKTCSLNNQKRLLFYLVVLVVSNLRKKKNWQLIGWVNVTVGFCPSSTCKGEEQWEQGVVTGGGKNQKYTSILSALNGQDARERDAHKLICQLHLLLVWLSPELNKTIWIS